VEGKGSGGGKWHKEIGVEEGKSKGRNRVKWGKGSGKEEVE
jgi:hypothetical protein